MKTVHTYSFQDNSLEKSEILVNRNTSEMVNGGGLESSNIFTVRDQDEVEENLCCSHEKVSIHVMVVVFDLRKN